MNKKLTSTVLLATILINSSYIYGNEVSVVEETSILETVVQEEGDLQETIEETIEETVEENQEIPSGSEDFITDNVEDSNTETDLTDEELESENITPEDSITEDVIQDETITGGIEDSANQEEVVPEEGDNIPGDQVVLTLDSKIALVNGKEHILLNPPKVINDRTFLPLRFVVDQILGAEVLWDNEEKKATVFKDDIEVIVKVGDYIATIDGMPVELDAPPIVENGTTMLPVRFMSEAFNIKTDYDSATRIVTLTGPNKGPNYAPVADFYFESNHYVSGQVVKAINTSSDPDGNKIVDQLWSVGVDNPVTNKELSNMFKTPKAGTYMIGLKVQDEYGLWSEWTYKEIIIGPNEAPKVTYLGSNHSDYAQGEALDIQYMYENESWEEITNEKWTYRSANEPVSKAILGKPDALFTEGEYIITLQIDDAYGNRSEVVETRIHITDEVKKKELTYRFTEGKIGDIIDNYQGFNYRDYADAMISEKTTVAGTMIMSDSPEVVKREGILYRDTINGEGRFLLHHINAFDDSKTVTGNKRLVLVAENTSDEVVTVTLGNKTIKGPVVDVNYLGQKVLYDYLVGTTDEVVILQPGEKKYIYDSQKKWVKDTCISGLMDITTTGPVTFTTAAVSPGSTLDSMDGTMELLLEDVHPRGTFDTVAINYTLNLDGSQPTKLLIGTGTEEWVNGYDAITLEPKQNRGNFGISYNITITATEDMGIILNPRATTFKGAIEWEGIGVYNIPTSGIIYSNTAKAVSLGTIKAGETKTFEYMLPNGSAAPVLIGFIPKSYWDK